VAETNPFEQLNRAVTNLAARASMNIAMTSDMQDNLKESGVEEHRVSIEERLARIENKISEFNDFKNELVDSGAYTRLIESGEETVLKIDSKSDVVLKSVEELDDVKKEFIDTIGLIVEVPEKSDIHAISESFRELKDSGDLEILSETSVNKVEEDVGIAESENGDLADIATSDEISEKTELKVAEPVIDIMGESKDDGFQDIKTDLASIENLWSDAPVADLSERTKGTSEEEKEVVAAPRALPASFKKLACSMRS
jgi:hypothetical protein